MDGSGLQSTAEQIKVVAVSVFFKCDENPYFGLFPSLVMCASHCLSITDYQMQFAIKFSRSRKMLKYARS